MADEPKVEPKAPDAPAPAPEPKVEPKAEPKAEDKKVSPSEPPTTAELKKVEEAPKPKAASVVPEKYDLKLPEGSLIDAARVENLSLFAKEKGFSNEQAQAVLERENEAVALFSKTQNEGYEKTKTEWKKSSETDTEIGGEKLKESVVLATSVLNRYFSDAFVKSMDGAGFFNHPELIRGLVKIGREMGPDRFVSGGAGNAPTVKASRADRIWGSSDGKAAN